MKSNLSFGYASVSGLSLNNKSSQGPLNSTVLPLASPNQNSLPILRHTISRDEYLPMAITKSPAGWELLLKRLLGGAASVTLTSDGLITGFELTNQMLIQPGLAPYRSALENIISKVFKKQSLS